MRAPQGALILSVILILGCATGSRRFKPARVASDKPLEYPLSAQLDKIEGEVVVGVFVDTDGVPEEVRLLESSGYPVLDSAAYRFSRTLTFNPAVVDDKKVSSWTKLVLRYRLSEVPFEETKWLNEVLHYQTLIGSTQDNDVKSDYLKKLYVRYLGLSQYVAKYGSTDINSSIKKVIHSRTFEQWKEFWGVIAVPFAVFDDFLYRYPQIDFKEQVQEDLISSLIDAEGEIRIRALRSSRLARIAPQLTKKIENRLDELQRKRLKLIEESS